MCCWPRAQSFRISSCRRGRACSRMEVAPRSPAALTVLRSLPPQTRTQEGRANLDLCPDLNLAPTPLKPNPHLGASQPAHSGTRRRHAAAGLSTFFSGLEGIVGSPDPNVLEAMRAEHSNGPDSFQLFTTANYGVTTTSEIEFHFVAEPEQPPASGWPAETKNASVRSPDGGGTVSVARADPALAAPRGSQRQNARLDASRP